MTVNEIFDNLNRNENETDKQFRRRSVLLSIPCNSFESLLSENDDELNDFLLRVYALIISDLANCDEVNITI